MTDRIASDVWLVWRLREGWIETLGAYETKAKAAEDVSVLTWIGQFGWQIKPVSLIGWAFSREGGEIYTNEAPVPSSKTTQ